jgi:hypothetical protein
MAARMSAHRGVVNRTNTPFREFRTPCRRALVQRGQTSRCHRVRDTCIRARAGRAREGKIRGHRDDGDDQRTCGVGRRDT